MSCFSEDTYLVYLDGELEPEARRDVETHLVGCRRCREQVVALQDEASLLADLLHERPAPSLHADPSPPPAHAVAAFLAPTVGLGALAILAVTWIAEWTLPPGLSWLNPFDAERIYTMAFDLLFALRRDAPELLRLLVSFAALGTASLMLLGLLSLAERRIARGRDALLAALALVGMAGAAPSPAQALDVRRVEAEVTVAEGETVHEALVATADTVRIDGIVEGDLAVASDRLILRGEVRGDVYAASRIVEISGHITGNLHMAGEQVRLDGRVEGDVLAFGRLVTFGPRSQVGRDAAHFGYGMNAEGRIGRDLFAVGEWLEVRGEVGRGVTAHAERVALLEGARIGGDVLARFWKEPAEVERAPGAQVAGSVRSQLYEHAARSRLEKWSEIGFHAVLVLRLGAAFALGLLLYVLVPGLFAVRVAGAGDFFRALGIGFLALVATPVALVLVAITLVGIPIALLGLALFLAAGYVSGIVVAVLLGSALTRVRRTSVSGFALALGVGLVLVILASEIPLVGVPVKVVVLLTGLGLLVERALAAWRHRGMPRAA